MGSWLRGCVVLFFLGTGPVDTKITQIPKHLVTAMGSKRTLNCEQYLGHNAMYWYKQEPEKPLELMFSYNYKELVQNETVPSRFTPDCPDSAHLHLHLYALEPGDSAVYLCASSQDTALQSHCLPMHKLPGPARKLWGRCAPLSDEALFSSPQDPDRSSDLNPAWQLIQYDNAKSHAQDTSSLRLGFALNKTVPAAEYRTETLNFKLFQESSKGNAPRKS
ncbi:T-cell receptor beta chain V region 86T1 [Tupaia chinensis]|nr:T-cell receptor beta chain V region 86T1 [Tupaia chinensis]